MSAPGRKRQSRPLLPPAKNGRADGGEIVRVYAFGEALLGRLLKLLTKKRLAKPFLFNQRLVLENARGVRL